MTIVCSKFGPAGGVKWDGVAVQGYDGQVVRCVRVRENKVRCEVYGGRVWGRGGDGRENEIECKGVAVVEADENGVEVYCQRGGLTS